MKKQKNPALDGRCGGHKLWKCQTVALPAATFIAHIKAFHTSAPFRNAAITEAEAQRMLTTSPEVQSEGDFPFANSSWLSLAVAAAQRNPLLFVLKRLDARISTT